MTTHHDPDDEEVIECIDDFDLHQNRELLHEELADYNNSCALSTEDGWFYSDED